MNLKRANVAVGLVALTLSACSTTSTTPTHPSAAPTPTTATGATPTASEAPKLSDVTASAPPNGVLALSKDGKGPTLIKVPSSTSSTTHVYFRAICDSGSFSLKNGDRLIFRGECDSRLNFEADAPVDYVKNAALSWTVSPDANWRMAVWNH
jgi:hypothetical protein